jgi:2-polyprenyl-3-methyl-5-hydroxy-6-metoxy-1,4-benzoquinol methylase
MNQKTEQDFHPSSFRDPSGFIFRQNNHIYRQVNESGASAYETLMQSGLYAELVKKKWLIPHVEVSLPEDGAYKVLQPQLIPFISYAYEWSFDMWRDAALLTLNICRRALKNKLILKDATPFNVQFVSGSPVFIDTLSFESYNETKPWVAYRQFCESFLGPLLLANYFGSEHLKLLQIYPGGIPVRYVAGLLPMRSWFNSLSLFNIHLQSKVAASSSSMGSVSGFTQQKLLNVLNHLYSGISSLQAPKNKTVWDDYYSTTIASDDYLAKKDLVFRSMLKETTGSDAIDLGANDGYFSKITAEAGYSVIATDIDSNSINRLYAVRNKQILPLILDLTAPTPAVGWLNEERESFFQRAEADLVLALALVHHLAIAENTPFRLIAKMLSAITRKFLIIEFVEKQDVKAKVLLERKSIAYEEYTRENFEAAILVYFDLVRFELLLKGDRRLYLFQRKTSRMHG